MSTLRLLRGLVSEEDGQGFTARALVKCLNVGAWAWEWPYPVILLGTTIKHHPISPVGIH